MLMRVFEQRLPHAKASGPAIEHHIMFACRGERVCSLAHTGGQLTPWLALHQAQAVSPSLSLALHMLRSPVQSIACGMMWCYGSPSWLLLCSWSINWL